MSHFRFRLSTIVSVAVMSGVVVCHFGYADDGIPAALQGSGVWRICWTSHAWDIVSPAWT
jgi:hypothetical protein